MGVGSAEAEVDVEVETVCGVVGILTSAVTEGGSLEGICGLGSTLASVGMTFLIRSGKYIANIKEYVASAGAMPQEKINSI